jgi:hypothetical protein
MPATRHDDLVAIHVDGGRVKADYFDSDGRVIRYVVVFRSGESRGARTRLRRDA